MLMHEPLSAFEWKKSNPFDFSLLRYKGEIFVIQLADICINNSTANLLFLAVFPVVVVLCEINELQLIARDCKAGFFLNFTNSRLFGCLAAIDKTTNRYVKLARVMLHGIAALLYKDMFIIRVNEDVRASMPQALYVCFFWVANCARKLVIFVDDIDRV